MAYNEVSWEFPQYAPPSLFNFVVSPGVSWNGLQNNPFISAFEVEYLDLEDGIWTPIGQTATNFIRFPADVYNGDALYQIRVATISADGLRSPWAYSIVTTSSPLAFNFTTSQTVRLANGAEVPNQRYLFLVL
jgi:hypothetical protein